jgi:hypothetical protein
VADLFDLGDLPSWLRQDPGVDTESATRVRRYVNGWLQDATGLTDWPSPVPDRLWAWAIELAALVWDNPTAKWTQTVDDSTDVFDRGPQGRRQEILAAARRAYNTAGKPQGSFPDPDWHWSVVPTVSSLLD